MKSKPKSTHPEIITKTEAAKRLGVSAGMVSKYLTLAKYQMPVRPDGRLDWDAVRTWHAARILPALSGSFLSRERKYQAIRLAKPPIGKEWPDDGDGEEFRVDEQLRVSRRLTSAAAQADFFRVARERLGLSAREAYAVVNWASFLVLHALDAVEDVDGEPDWRALIGPSDDLGAVEEWYERAVAQELKPDATHGGIAR